MSFTRTGSQDHAGLHTPGYDRLLIFGVPALALGAGGVVLSRPAWFEAVLVLNLWLLGYHHVMSTYTRLVFDAESRRRYFHLYTTLPVLVLVATGGLAAAGGAALIATVYLHWQWFHYTRQSEGISRAYAARAGRRDLSVAWLPRLVFWSWPLAGMLCVSARAPERFLGLPIHTLPVPWGLAEGAVALAAALTTAWLVRELPAVLRGDTPRAWFLFLLSHCGIFLTAYILVSELNPGWLVVNIWHNAQYIAFVWLFNRNRFADRLDPQARFLSYLCMQRHVLLYLGVCFAFSTSLYLVIDIVGAWLATGMLPVALILYQALNFHHYIVDAVIWKLRRPEVGSRLRLPFTQQA